MARFVQRALVDHGARGSDLSLAPALREMRKSKAKLFTEYLLHESQAWDDRAPGDIRGRQFPANAFVL